MLKPGVFPTLGRNNKVEEALELDFINSAINSEAAHAFLENLERRGRGLFHAPMKRGETYEQYELRLRLSQLAKDAYPVFERLKKVEDPALAFMLRAYAAVVDNDTLHQMERELDSSALLAFRAFREAVSEVIDDTKRNTPGFALPDYLSDYPSSSREHVNARTQNLRDAIASNILAKVGVVTPAR